jgi:hypothetical protein
MPESSQRNGEEIKADDRVYQTDSGKMYIDTDEFVRSEEGQQLIDRFLKSTPRSSGGGEESKSMGVPDKNLES